MNDSVSITNVATQTIAAARQRTNREKISSEIGQLLAAPWQLIRATPGLQERGRNVAIYWEFRAEAGIEVGVEVVRQFADTESVVCSQIPGGRVATIVYYGEYSGLGSAHDAIIGWCSANDETLAGPFWEIYGHWEEDAKKRRTDVYYLLTQK